MKPAPFHCSGPRMIDEGDFFPKTPHERCRERRVFSGCRVTVHFAASVPPTDLPARPPIASLRSCTTSKCSLRDSVFVRSTVSEPRWAGPWLGRSLCASQTSSGASYSCTRPLHAGVPPDVLEARVTALCSASMEEYSRLVSTHALAEGASSPLFDWPVGMIAANDRQTYEWVRSHSIAGRHRASCRAAREGPRSDRRGWLRSDQTHLLAPHEDLPEGHHFAPLWAACAVRKMLPVHLAAKTGA